MSNEGNTNNGMSSNNGYKPELLPSQALSISLNATNSNKAEFATQVSDTLTFNGFKVGNINLLLTSTTGCQVVLQNQIYPMPNTPVPILGVTSYKGDVIPVYSLLRYLSKETNLSSCEQFLLVFESQGDYIGLTCDQLPTKKTFHSSQIKAAHLDIDQKLRPAIVRQYQDDKGEIWLHLDEHSFFERLVANTQ